jgi:hypothetical protein
MPKFSLIRMRLRGAVNEYYSCREGSLICPLIDVVGRADSDSY